MATLGDVNIYNTPALEPPPGVIHNPLNSPSLPGYMVATSAVCLTLTTLAIGARTFTKFHVLQQVGLAALTAGTAGGGNHQWNVSIAGVQRVLLLVNIDGILYSIIMFPAKLSVLLQMMRIFRGTTKTSIHWIIQTLIAANFLFYTAFAFAWIFECVPRAKLWEPALPGRCISSNNTILTSSAINLVSDVSILLLPIFATWKLKIPVKKKFMIAAVFGTGVFACISSTIRLVYSIRLAQTNDVMWAIIQVGTWSMVELTAVILVGAFPVMPKFIQYCRGHASNELSAPSSERSTKPSKSNSTNPPCRKFPTHGSSFDEPVPSSKLGHARLEEPMSFDFEKVHRGI